MGPKQLCNGRISGSETPVSSTTIALDGSDDERKTSQETMSPSGKEETKTDESSKEINSDDGEKDDPKKRRGWPSRVPFHKSYENESRSYQDGKEEERIYWGDLTLKQKIAWRKAFLREYLSETKQCLPYVRKFFLMIYRISSWRAVVVFALNVASGLLPALTLQTRGTFIMMVHNQS